MSTYPKSPKEMTGGMMYFPRMLDKIRLHGRGELPEITMPTWGGEDGGRRVHEFCPDKLRGLVARRA